MQANNLEVVIMAAGMGSRFGGLKQIDGMGPSGEFLMDYAIYDAYRAGVRAFCLVVRENFRQQLVELMNSKWKNFSDMKFRFVCQELNEVPEKFTPNQERTKPWGTAHVLYVLRRSLTTPFVIMNADDFYGRAGIGSLLSFLRETSDQHALVGYPLKKTLSPYGPVTRGVCEVRDDLVMDIDEVSKIYADDPRDSFASMNLWGFQPSIFPFVADEFEKFLETGFVSTTSEYQIPQMVSNLLRAKKIQVRCIPTDSPWFGVTYQEDKEQVQKKIQNLIASGEYPNNLFAGV
jgi:NDP-sugar pyrophosphorylase family protein